MNSTCPDGWTNNSEFTVLPICSIPITAYMILNMICLTLGALCFSVCATILVVRRNIIFIKRKHVIILIILSLVQILIMSLRPLFNISFAARSHNSLWMAYLVHISGLTAANVVILAIFNQIKVITDSAMKEGSNVLTRKKGSILIVISIAQTIMFLAGPLISKYAPLRYGIMFWSSVIMIAGIVIPYYCIAGFIVYRKVITMQNRNFESVGRRILLSTILFSAVGSFTIGVGIYLILQADYEWCFTELCWIFNIAVNSFIFVMMSRARTKKPTITIEATGTKSGASSAT